MNLSDIEKLCETAVLHMWAEKGNIQSHLLYFVELDGTNGIVYVPYNGDSKRATQQQALNLLALMKTAGVFRAVCLVGEAWTSCIPKDKAALVGVLRPTLDPDRKECVFVSVFKDNEKSFKGWEIKRDEKRKGTLELLKGWDRDAKNNESWLDPAMAPVNPTPQTKLVALQLLRDTLEKGQ